MASGDVISAITTVGGFTSFQPAAGVEAVVMFTATNNGADLYLGLTNGVTNTYNFIATANVNIGSFKIPINNTNYLYYYGVAAQSFTGIQIK
jgi:hypothetical protein